MHRLTSYSLSRHVQHLDQTLGGGIACGSLTELVGPAGVGKSQLCMMLSISALMPPLPASPPAVSCFRTHIIQPASVLIHFLPGSRLPLLAGCTCSQ